jgi:signal transduction histidine kinase/pSer/pThr/pTyr-binding forkhead associated (FHA) protein
VRRLVQCGDQTVPRLIVIKGADEGKQFDLADDVVAIGRDVSQRVRLVDTEVSRRHAEVHLLEGRYWVRDLASANGTFVNNQKISDALLHPGDQILIGQTVLVYHTGQPSTPDDSLARRISMIARNDLELSSAIVKTIAENEGSRILSRPDQVKTPWLKTALANLRIMYETSQAVSHILDLNQLLERILELVTRSIEADRGCVMLRNADTGHFEPKAVLTRDADDGQEKIAVSRTIMEHVLREKQGVLISDASQDERFNQGQSVLRLGIREVICVPMKGRHETLGVLYLDTRSSPREFAGRGGTDKFTEDHLALAIAIGHQAALAVEETRYHQALVQAERLAAIGQTIAALSHHIKNILQGLRSGSEILQMGLNEKDEPLLLQGWKIVEKNQGKIYDLVMDMLSYSKDREPAVESTDLNNVVKDVLELARGRIGHVPIEPHLARSLPRIQVDPEGLHRALLNIVNNALDAVEDRNGPRVQVQTIRDPEVGWVRIIVVDNGCGIPPEKQADIFRPFVSTKGSRGTGLGLPVSRKILREHGGDILVQSQVGVGSKFILRLPMRSPLVQEMTGTELEMPNLPPLEDDTVEHEKP